MTSISSDSFTRTCETRTSDSWTTSCDTLLSQSTSSSTYDVLSLTHNTANQEGTAFYQVTATTADTINVAFDMYIGDGTGADGLCVNLGENNLGGNNEEAGVAVGFSLCFTEYDGGDVIMRQDSAEVWSNLGTTFQDETWHAITVAITPVGDAAFTLDSGVFHGTVNIAAYNLPSDLYLGFSARTGGATNNHWVRNVAFGTVAHDTSGWNDVDAQFGDSTVAVSAAFMTSRYASSCQNYCRSQGRTCVAGWYGGLEWDGSTGVDTCLGSSTCSGSCSFPLHLYYSTSTEKYCQCATEVTIDAAVPTVSENSANWVRLGVAGTLSCQDGDVKITDATECKNAVDQIGSSWHTADSLMAREDRPDGCFKDDSGSGYSNDNHFIDEHATALDGYTPICKTETDLHFTTTAHRLWLGMTSTGTSDECLRTSIFVESPVGSANYIPMGIQTAFTAADDDYCSTDRATGETWENVQLLVKSGEFHSIRALPGQSIRVQLTLLTNEGTNGWSELGGDALETDMSLKCGCIEKQTDWSSTTDCLSRTTSASDESYYDCVDVPDDIDAEEYEWREQGGSANGKASNFVIQQVHGKLYFAWEDNSLCETAFTLARDGESFVSDVAHDPGADHVCGHPVAPEEVFDDLALGIPASVDGPRAVGTVNEYCVSAVATVSAGSASGAYSSTAECVSHTVQFEAVILGSAVTKEARLPSSGVEVSWTMVTADGTVLAGPTVTSDSQGNFVIHVITDVKVP